MVLVHKPVQIHINEPKLVHNHILPGLATTNTLKLVLNQILDSPISLEKVAVVKRLHSILVQRDSELDREVKQWINQANVARGKKGGSLIYLVVDAVVQEAVIIGQEDGEAVMGNESETEPTINPSVT